MGTRYNRLTEAVLSVPTIYVLSKNNKIIIFFYLKIFIFTAVKNRCILYGHEFVMRSTGLTSFSACMGNFIEYHNPL